MFAILKFDDTGSFFMCNCNRIILKDGSPYLHVAGDERRAVILFEGDAETCMSTLSVLMEIEEASRLALRTMTEAESKETMVQRSSAIQDETCVSTLEIEEAKSLALRIMAVVESNETITVQRDSIIRGWEHGLYEHHRTSDEHYIKADPDAVKREDACEDSIIPSLKTQSHDFSIKVNGDTNSAVQADPEAVKRENDSTDSIIPSLNTPTHELPIKVNSGTNSSVQVDPEAVKQQDSLLPLNTQKHDLPIIVNDCTNSDIKADPEAAQQQTACKDSIMPSLKTPTHDLPIKVNGGTVQADPEAVKRQNASTDSVIPSLKTTHELPIKVNSGTNSSVQVDPEAVKQQDSLLPLKTPTHDLPIKVNGGTVQADPEAVKRQNASTDSVIPSLKTTHELPINVNGGTNSSVQADPEAVKRQNASTESVIPSLKTPTHELSIKVDGGTNSAVQADPDAVKRQNASTDSIIPSLKTPTHDLPVKVNDGTNSTVQADPETVKQRNACKDSVMTPLNSQTNELPIKVNDGTNSAVQADPEAVKRQNACKDSVMPKTQVHDSSVNLYGGSNCVVPVTPELDKQQEACKDSFMSPIIQLHDSTVKIDDGSNSFVRAESESNKVQHAMKTSFKSYRKDTKYLKYTKQGASSSRLKESNILKTQINKIKAQIQSSVNMNGGVNVVLQAESDERQIAIKDPSKSSLDSEVHYGPTKIDVGRRFGVQSELKSDERQNDCQNSCSWSLKTQTHDAPTKIDVGYNFTVRAELKLNEQQNADKHSFKWSLKTQTHGRMNGSRLTQSSSGSDSEERRGAISGPKQSRDLSCPISSEDSDDDVRKGEKPSFKSGKSTEKRRHRESDSEPDFDDILHNRTQRKRAFRIYSSASSGSDSEESLSHYRRVKRKDDEDPLVEVAGLTRKRHFCYFCHNAFQRLDVHFANKHRDQPLFAQMDLFPRNSPGRKERMVALIRLGDYTHNTTVIREKKGRLVLARGRDVEFNEKLIDMYLPCPHCLGFLNKLYLWKHADFCVNQSAVNDDSNLGRSLLQQGRAFMLGDDVVQDDEFKLYILAKMSPDDVGQLAKTDRAIVLFGLSLFIQKGIPAAYNIRNKMRTVARLLMEIHKHQSGSLLSFLKPAHFDLIVQCVRNIAEFYKPVPSESMKPSFKKPSLALKLGYFLKALAMEVRCESLKNKEYKEMTADLPNFVTLLDTQYKKRVSYQAISEIRRQPNKTAKVLPLTQDLLHLKKVTEEKIETCTSNPERCNGDRKTWTELAKAVLARIIVFNARRSGEAAKMRLSDYNARMTYDEAMISDEFKSLMSDIEASMGQQLELVELIGKNGKPVPCLLTPPVQKAMELLNNTRKSVGVSKANPYFFARAAGGSVGCIRGGDALRAAAQSCAGELLKAQNINSKNVRKYVATVGNLIEAKDRDLGWLNRHFGHSEGVHQLFYNIHTEAIEMTKVGILLSAIDGGKIGRLVKSGKKLEDITDKDLPETIGKGKPKLNTEEEALRSELLRASDESEDDETRPCDTRDPGRLGGRQGRTVENDSAQQSDDTDESENEDTTMNSSELSSKIQKPDSSDSSDLEGMRLFNSPPAQPLSTPQNASGPTSPYFAVLEPINANLVPCHLQTKGLQDWTAEEIEQILGGLSGEEIDYDGTQNMMEENDSAQLSDSVGKDEDAKVNSSALSSKTRKRNRSDDFDGTQDMIEENDSAEQSEPDGKKDKDAKVNLSASSSKTQKRNRSDDFGFIADDEKETLEENRSHKAKSLTPNEKRQESKTQIDLSNKKTNHWEISEKTSILRFFRKHIEKLVVPRKKDIDLWFLKHPGELSGNRTWLDVKNCVYNVIQKNRKLIKEDKTTDFATDPIADNEEKENKSHKAKPSTPNKEQLKPKTQHDDVSEYKRKVNPWQDSEKKLVLNGFRKHIEKLIVPRKKEVQDLLRTRFEGKLNANRTWEDVKNCVYNVIQKNRKLIAKGKTLDVSTGGKPDTIEDSDSTQESEPDGNEEVEDLTPSPPKTQKLNRSDYFDLITDDEDEEKIPPEPECLQWKKYSPWQISEKILVLTRFRTHIEKQKVPSKKEIMKMLSTAMFEGKLSGNRTLDDVQTYVKSAIKKIEERLSGKEVQTQASIQTTDPQRKAMDIK